MDRRWALAFGLAGVLVAHGAAVAQFASERTPPPAPPPAPLPAQPAPTRPAAALPSFPAAAAPTAAYPPVQQASFTQPAPQPAPEPPHPYAARPEHGPWMICVKSYTNTPTRSSGQARELLQPDPPRVDTARQMAEELAADIRQSHRVPAWLFEWGAEERQKEEAKRAFIRQKMQEEYAPFLRKQQELKAKAAADGVEFVDSPAKYRLPTVEYTTQWAVLIGGFKDMDAARKYLDTVRRWEPPAGKHLMDQALMSRPTDKGGAERDGTYINPFANALVLPNPAVKRSGPANGVPVDPALEPLNKEEELSLLKVRRPWTLMVKTFSVPTRVVTRDDDPGVIGRLFGNGSNGADVLEATAKQARELARALREPNMQPQPFEAFVLHTRTASIVTVGQFDAPDAPDLLRTQQILQGMTFKVYDKDPKKNPTARMLEERRMFDGISLMPVPQVPQAQASGRR